MEYLEFELPVKQAQEQLDKCLELNAESGVDINDSCDKLKENLEKVKKEVYGNLTPWQKVQLSRHPGRPYTLDYIDHFTKGKVLDLHGDRYYGDDKAMVGRLGSIGRQTFMMIGQQKGKNTKQRQERRFGMSNPEGYRKALRLMKLAEKFNIPILTLVDTPGAYPGLEAEERGQGEAIAKNIYEMLGIKVPIITVVIGEGASGGALGIGVGNTVLMMQYTWYSVISPESCSSILWRSWDYKEQAAEQLNLTADEMLRNKLIDGIIKEPLGGAQYDPEAAFKSVQNAITREYKKLAELSPEELIKKRQNKYLEMGVYNG